MSLIYPFDTTVVYAAVFCVPVLLLHRQIKILAQADSNLEISVIYQRPDLLFVVLISLLFFKVPQRTHSLTLGSLLYLVYYKIASRRCGRGKPGGINIE